MVKWLTVLLHIQEWVQISAQRPAIRNEIFHGFPQSLQPKTQIVPYKLGHTPFLPNPFQFIIHLSPYPAGMTN
jgi:hypothetical protein